MLINCPECNRNVSDSATACLSCAYPLKPAVTMEQTAKTWKALLLYSFLVIFGGVCLATGFDNAYLM